MILTVTPSAASAVPSGLPGLDLLMEKAGASGSVIVYQPYLNAAQRAQIDADAIALDISFNTDGDTREYELFKILHAHHDAIGLGDDIHWGMLSSKFETKAVSSVASFLSDAASARSKGADAYLYNPLIGHAAIYSTVWEHALMGGHPGMEGIFQYLRQTGHPVTTPQGETAFFFCNYICGNRKFWNGYFAFCDAVLGGLEDEGRRGTPAGIAYTGKANYSRDQSAKMRPFVIERLLGLYIQQKATVDSVQVSAFSPDLAAFEWKFGVRLGTLLHRLYALKQAFLQTNDSQLLARWQEERQALIKQPMLIWHADDPPAWMPRGLLPATGPEAPVSAAPKQVSTQPVTVSPPAAAPTRTDLKAFAGGWEAHKDRHCIWIVTPENYTHSHAFDEVALGLQGAFEELGGSAPIVRQAVQLDGRSPIIYGANLLAAEMVAQLPADSVVVNLEQVSDDSKWLGSRYMTIMQQLPVLDYSSRNRDNLAAKGISHAGVLEIGYSSRLTQIAHAGVKDIDILFYGSMNERRFKILKRLEMSGLKVVHLFNVYGQQRDAAIARARIVINIHHYESAVFEIVRISYLLANRVCVLSEGDSADPDLQPFSGGLAVEPYGQLIERCYALLEDKVGRDAMADQGFKAMTSRSQAQMLIAVMEQGA